MPRLCIWCGNELATIIGQEPVTNMVCPTCLHNITQSRTSLKKILNRYTFPVLVIDKSGNTQYANSSALLSLDQKLEIIKNQPGGNVIRCIHSYLDEGCGNTIHCAACTIRNTVMATHRDGKSRNKIEAYNYIKKGDEVKKVQLYISTEKLDEIVLLKLDQMNVMPEINR